MVGPRAQRCSLNACCARLSPRQQHFAVARVLRERGRTLELRARLGMPCEPFQQIATRSRQPGIVAQRGFLAQRIDEIERRLRPLRHAHRHGAIQAHHWRCVECEKRIVDRDDLRPVRRRRARRARMARRERGLQRIGGPGRRAARRAPPGPRARASAKPAAPSARRGHAPRLPPERVRPACGRASALLRRARAASSPGPPWPYSLR